MDCKAVFEKISPNIASLIAEFLTIKDLINLGSSSQNLRTIFYEFKNSWKAILNNLNLPESVISKLKNIEDYIALFQKKLIKADKYYIKLSFEGKNWLIFPAYDINYDWKGSEYWPLQSHKESWFGETPIPHLVNVCWLRMYGDFVIPRGKYSLNLRICADKNLKLYNSYFTLNRENCDELMIKFVFDSEVVSSLKNNAGKFTILKLGAFDLTNYPEKYVKVLFRSYEGNNWWKSGFWLDAVLFIPI